MGYIPWGHKESDMTEATQPTLIKKKNHVSAISLFTSVLKFSFIFLNIILYYSLQINHIIRLFLLV